jgi:hypothetical protein
VWGGGGSGSQTTYTIGGTVENLAVSGAGLVLQNNSKDSLSVNANGSFTFANSVASGTSYSVTISLQPSNPVQTCIVMSGSGIATADVTDIQVNCGHNEWTWQKGPSTTGNSGVYGTLGVAAATNNPGGRQTPVTWTDGLGNLWLFGGNGLDSTGAVLPMNDLWKYTGGQWAWISGSAVGAKIGTYGSLGVHATSNIPGARLGGISWTDTSGNFWLFGGSGYDSTNNSGPLNDLWKYGGGEWTWMGGSDHTGQQGTYGTQGVPSVSNIPGARSGAVSWSDSSGNFWLFGGSGYDSVGNQGLLNDLWKYSSGEWTWESGSNTANQNGVYGTMGTSTVGNVPGARFGGSGWVDLSGNLWLFGGTGYDSSASLVGFLNDVWKYSNGQWSWTSGSSLRDQGGVYGQQGVPATGNIPGSRINAISWTDSSGNFWLFGGGGMNGLLNDLWKYNSGEWTWISGSDLTNQSGTYGVQGMTAPGNIPGARFEMAHWLDSSGNLWLFGGSGAAQGTRGYLSDLWMYTP